MAQIILDEGAAAATPSAAKVTLYAKADGLLYSKDDAGVETLVSGGAGGAVSDGDKGDITVSSSGTVWAIDTTAVTYAKIQNVSATDKVLGRSTAGAGSTEEISCTSSGRAMIGAATAAAQTALLDAVVGDSGSGGTKGMVPAPAAGDTAAGKFLKASGAWVVPAGGGDALTTQPLSQFAATTSAQLAGVISNETGSGALVFATSPTFVTPVLGTPSSGDFSTGSFTWPTFNQSTSGSAATLTTPRAIYGNNFDGSAALAQVIASTYGGTGNGFTKFSGPTTAEKTFTLPDASASLAILGTNTFTGAQILSDQQVSRGMFLDCGNTVVDKGNINNATVTFDYTGGSIQTYTATGSTVTWAFSNWPPTGNEGYLLIRGTNMGAFTHAITGVTWLKPDGTTTTTLATYLAANTGRIAFQTSGVDQILLWSRDAGTTVYGKLI